MANQNLDRFFEKREEEGVKLTFGDVRMHTNYSEISPENTNISSRFSRRIPLLIPIVSSAMDTVTEAKMAIAMAELGGLGIIHKNMSPEEQAKQVRMVKLYVNGRIESPICIEANSTVAEVEAWRASKGFKFHSFPVTGQKGELLGLVTRSDFRFVESPTMSVAQIMTSRDNMVIAPASTTPEDALAIMRKHKKNALPLVDENSRVVGMYVFSDLSRIHSGQSSHNVDAKGQLIVAAAVGAGSDALSRAAQLAKVGCDVFVIDTAHGDSKNVHDTIKALKKSYPHIDVVAGNVSRGEATKRLIDVGADGVLVGQGPGSICTTRIVAGIGCPQVSAIYDCARAARGTDVPVCGDGGIQNSGDIAIALAVGAQSVILGSLLAGTKESPGEVVLQGQKQVKLYRGMGSLGAMLDRAESRSRYGQGGVSLDKLVPEGVEGTVPYKGDLSNVINQCVGGLRGSMAYHGQVTLAGLRDNVEIFRMTGAGLTESHPHDITV